MSELSSITLETQETIPFCTSAWLSIPALLQLPCVSIFTAAGKKCQIQISQPRKLKKLSKSKAKSTTLKRQDTIPISNISIFPTLSLLQSASIFTVTVSQCHIVEFHDPRSSKNDTHQYFPS